jgi:hypothetical protein
MEMVATHFACAGIDRELFGRKHVLPEPLLAGVGVLTLQCEGQGHEPSASVHVFGIQSSHIFKVILQHRHDTVREDCHTVLHSLSVVDHDLVSGKVEVLDAKTEAFHESQTAAVEDLGYHLVYSR